MRIKANVATVIRLLPLLYCICLDIARIKIEPKAAETLKKVHSFLDGNFDKMITYLTVAGVKRNSLSESGIRMLRRLEVGQEGNPRSNSTFGILLTQWTQANVSSFLQKVFVTIVIVRLISVDR